MKLRMKALIVSAFSITATLAMVLFFSPACLAQGNRAINPSNASGLPFSEGVVAGNTLYVAGQEGTDDKGKLVPGGITGETKAALQNIERIVKAAGFEMKDIVSCHCILGRYKRIWRHEYRVSQHHARSKTGTRNHSGSRLGQQCED
jgi:enamine deaminase RidA (YjgF/YER057c/UK114 family)